MTIRIRLSRDYRLVGQPEVLNSGAGPLFEATRDSAVQALIKGQPYDMLSQSTYDVWKDITLNFNPREVYAPEPSETSTPAPPKMPPEDRAFYTNYFPTGIPEMNCEKPLLSLQDWISLEECRSLYKEGSFIEWDCERETLLKQRTAPRLLEQHDIKWLSNVANRRRVCMNLLAKKGELSMWDKISRWWNREKP